MGLSRSFEQNNYYVSIHTCVPTSRLKWVIQTFGYQQSLTFLLTRRRRFFHEHCYPHFRFVCWKSRSFRWDSCPIWYVSVCVSCLISYKFIPTGLSVTSPRQAPALFSKTSAKGVPIPALLLTSSISALCFGSSFIGSGALWGWLQNIVGVSNQVCLHLLFEWATTDDVCV